MDGPMGRIYICRCAFDTQDTLVVFNERTAVVLRDGCYSCLSV